MFGNDLYLFLKESPGTSLALGFGVGVIATVLMRKSSLFMNNFKTAGVQGAKGETASSITGEYKMVLIVRNDLKMGKGKIAAQCAHAAVGAVEKLAYENLAAVRHWQRQGQPKVVLKVEDESSFFDLQKAARTQNLNTCIISDAGRTQIVPGSKTVLAVGPGPIVKIDQVTGHLKLL
ncbi:peptidyl-tRNA hydrolase [Plakobranchus ocellatus]|uniref:peptidyl-tRNA hydrolase n=1 Tax=Plakobranchus ocellatus TaxID=259542 RepID=A0AAV3ZW66_9GAST|nr:peptidyl-tRNA hydrolase [Plakobranchus ocellatus]